MPGIGYYFMNRSQTVPAGITTTDIVLAIIVLGAMAVSIYICTRY